jgi:putative nucleotidyltransferase with HDIG domain
MSEPHLEPTATEAPRAGAVVVELDQARRRSGRVPSLGPDRRIEPRASSSQGSRWMRVMVAVLLAFFGAVALGPRLLRADLPTSPALLGTPARGVVKADRDYALVDTAVTMEHRRRAADSALSVWDLDDVGSLRRAQALHKALLRTAVAIEGYRRGGKDERRDSPDELAAAVRSHEDVRAIVAGELSELGLEAPPDAEWRALFSVLWWAPAAADALATTTSHALQEPIVASNGGPPAGIEQLRVRGVRSGEERSVDVNDVNDVKEARLRLEHTIRAVLAELGPPSPAGEWNRSVVSVARWLSSHLQANLTWNAAETEHRRQDAADRVPPVIVRAWRGETVLRPGEVITERHQILVRAMMLQQEDGLRTRATVGTGFFVALVVSVVYLFGAKRVFQRRLRHRDVMFLGAMLGLEIVLLLVADVASPWVVASVPWVQPAMLAFALPIACGPMVVRLTMPPDVALLFALVVALLGGVVVEGGMAWAVTTTLGAMTGVAIVSDGARRLTPLVAGLGVGVVGVGAALTLELFRGALTGTALLALLGACLVGGIGSGLVALVCVPLVEDVFGYVTNRRLSRLAHLNQPLLKDLIVHAPGTWHHSVRVAVLAESGASAVGGNPLLARVMSLYHDIGKISRPQSFRENQTTTENPHDRLAPEESAAILRGHVEEGLALAREHALPSAVAAVIEEHHGDSFMEGFFEKARARQRESGGDAVDEAVFRYRGRRPHSKESAIVMLADHIESAARSLKDEPSDERIAELVDAVVNRSLTAGVLTMCDLSLRDLERARIALKGSLGGLLRGETHRERSEEPWD